VGLHFIFLRRVPNVSWKNKPVICIIQRHVLVRAGCKSTELISEFLMLSGNQLTDPIY
jgi:hypothetical protein